MIHVADTSFDGERAEAHLETLLGGHDDASVVDSLFAMPDDAALEAETDAVDRAVHDRLQARLAQKMRRLIEIARAVEASSEREDAA